MNRRCLESDYRIYLHPDQEADGDRSILFKDRTSAFGRPFWPVVSSSNAQAFEPQRWGFIPKHITSEEEAKEYLKQYSTFNAIAEDIEKKQTYREAWAKGQRCLIPVTSFTEWQHVPIEGKKAVNKIPYTIGTKEPVFTLGGVWTETALGYRTYTVLTTKANPLMEVIHNTKKRMPVIIPKDMHAFWLSPTLPLDYAKLLCDPYPEKEMVAVAA